MTPERKLAFNVKLIRFKLVRSANSHIFGVYILIFLNLLEFQKTVNISNTHFTYKK